VARILAVWEYGEGLGHLYGLIPLARALRERGHGVAFALRDATRLAVTRSAGFDSWPAPVLRIPGRVDRAPVSHADILLNLGFGDAGSLAGTQRAWDGLLRATRAEAIVADYAPGALLAAARQDMPRATFGSGFALPAGSDPFPALRPWEAEDGASLRALDDRLRAALGDAFPGAAPPIEALLHGLIDLVATWAQLDPLGPRDAQYVGPASPTREAPAIEWREPAGPRVLAYLIAAEPRFVAAVEALRTCGAEVILVAAGLNARNAAALSRDALRVIPAPVALAGLIEGATLCVSHGGAGLTAQAVKAGVPLALLPFHLEQSLVTRRLHALGAATARTVEQGVGDLGGWLRAALDDERLRACARNFAQAHQGAPDGALLAAERIDAWLG
jgi:UDP:flavonoid glycosyltransferase YjiC (YdhE family)